jgi:hypothetical protein
LRLPQKLEKNLLAYAAAAGGGLIGLAHPAEAQIIYTPSNIPLAEAFAGSAITQFDINNDGTPDFKFTEFQYQTMGLGGSSLKIMPDQNSNEIVGVLIKGENQVTAAALEGGVEVGPNANFQSSPNGLIMGGIFFGTSGGPPLGSWRKVETAYLGLKFVVNNQTHYGWVRIKFISPGGYEGASISGYAYEATANQPINTGQTSSATKKKEQTVSQAVPDPTARADQRNQSLGMLALGAAARTSFSAEAYLP